MSPENLRIAEQCKNEINDILKQFKPSEGESRLSTSCGRTYTVANVFQQTEGSEWTVIKLLPRGMSFCEYCGTSDNPKCINGSFTYRIKRDGEEMIINFAAMHLFDQHTEKVPQELIQVAEKIFVNPTALPKKLSELSCALSYQLMNLQSEINNAKTKSQNGQYEKCIEYQIDEPKVNVKVTFQISTSTPSADAAVCGKCSTTDAVIEILPKNDQVKEVIERHFENQVLFAFGAFSAPPIPVFDNVTIN